MDGWLGANTAFMTRLFDDFEFGDGAEMFDKIRRLLFDFRRKRLPSQSRGGSHKISQNITKYQIAGCPAGPDDEALTTGQGKQARVELQSG